MSNKKLIIKSLWHYRHRNLVIALGMAIGMAVITGALVTGDSVRNGLRSLVGIRLGEADLAVTAADRFFTDSLAVRVSADLGIPAASVLQMQGSATAGGGEKRLSKVQVYGVDESFTRVLGPGSLTVSPDGNGATISDNLAQRLGVTVGDEILIRLHKPGPVPMDAPFVSDEGNIVSTRVLVNSIAGKDAHGRFHLQNTQSAPYNIFLSKKFLQKLVGLGESGNLMLLAGKGKIRAVQAEESLAANRTLGDAGLNLQRHPVTGEWVLRTPRVFFDLPTLSAIEREQSDKTLWFSYFVNEFRLNDHSTPYSFVSTLPGERIEPGDMIINRWLADDLQAATGDTVEISYFMVGPLRKLTVEKVRFRVAEIIPMDDPGSDPLLMPEIPGVVRCRKLPGLGNEHSH
jgi:hypothetical protein